MTFSSTKKIRKNITIAVGSSTLGSVNEYKYLGVTLDNHLKFNQHIQILKKSIVFHMLTLKRIRHLMNIKELLLLFKSKIMPFFDQGDYLYDISNVDQVCGLQVLQNKCLKIVLK